MSKRTVLYPDVKAPQAPKAQDIHECFGARITKEEANKIRQLMKGKADPLPIIATAKNGLNVKEPPYHYLAWLHYVMMAIDKIVDGYGVEGCMGTPVKWKFPQQVGDTAFTYVNMGETYTPTVIYIPYKDRFVLRSWGDTVEWMENNNFFHFK